ncbi:MAG: hypothetical protein ABJK39_14410 [Hyphomicrobiales bacterium]
MNILSEHRFDTQSNALKVGNDIAFDLAFGIFINNLTLTHPMIKGIWAGIV